MECGILRCFFMVPTVCKGYHLFLCPCSVVGVNAVWNSYIEVLVREGSWNSIWPNALKHFNFSLNLIVTPCAQFCPFYRSCALICQTRIQSTQLSFYVIIKTASAFTICYMFQYNWSSCKNYAEYKNYVKGHCMRTISSLQNFPLLQFVMLYKNLFTMAWIIWTVTISHTCSCVFIKLFLHLKKLWFNVIEKWW